LLVWVSTQEAAQIVDPATHEEAQRPAEQTCPPLHVMPQPPQFAGSPMVGMQRPLHNVW